MICSRQKPSGNAAVFLFSQINRTLLFNSEAKSNPLVRTPLAHNSANNFRVFPPRKNKKGDSAQKHRLPSLFLCLTSVHSVVQTATII